MATASGVLGALNTAGSAAYNDTRQATAITRQSDFQAKLAEMDAQDALSRGRTAAGQVGQAGAAAIGGDRAKAAASGIDPNAGSAVDVQGDQANFSALDQQTIENNARREAWGYRTDATLSGLAAQQQAASLRQKAFSTLLTGGENAYGIYREGRVADYGWRRGGAASPSASKYGPSWGPKGFTVPGK